MSKTRDDDGHETVREVSESHLEILGRRYLSMHTSRFNETVVERRIRIGPFIYTFDRRNGHQIGYRYTSVISDE